MTGTFLGRTVKQGATGVKFQGGIMHSGRSGLGYWVVITTDDGRCVGACNPDFQVALDEAQRATGLLPRPESYTDIG